MNERDKKRLQINNRELIHNLMVNEIQDYLYERGILTQDNVEALLNDKSPQKAARRLVVTILPRKGPEAFEGFCEALREAGYDYIAEKLETTKVDDNTLCGDNKCKHERNQLLKTSRNLEDELEDLKERVKQVSVEAENVKTEQKRVQTKVEDLEHENYMLKKQLSFYEEREEPRPHSKVTKSSSTGSFNISGSKKHKQRNSFSGFTLDTKMEDDVFRSRDEAHAPLTPLYDEYDDKFLDDLDNSLYDKINDPSFETFRNYDDIDGPIRDPGESQKSSKACSISRAPESTLTSSSSPPIRRIRSPKLSEEADCELSFLLTDDIIGYFFTGKKKKPAELDRMFAQYILVMRRAVDSMSEKHGRLIEQISRQVDISASWEVMIGQLQDIFNDFMADEFHHSALFWGRTVALYTLSGYIARKCARRHKEVQPLREFLTDFVNVRLGKKIRSTGGWDTFCEFIEAGGDSFPAIFPASMIQAAITAASTAHAHTRRKTPPTDTDVTKEDMLKTI